MTQLPELWDCFVSNTAKRQWVVLDDIHTLIERNLSLDIISESALMRRLLPAIVHLLKSSTVNRCRSKERLELSYLVKGDPLPGCLSLLAFP